MFPDSFIYSFNKTSKQFQSFIKNKKQKKTNYFLQKKEKKRKIDKNGEEKNINQLF